MDEMQALRELRREVRPASPHRMAALRAGLFRSMTTPPPRRRFGLPKLAWRVGLAGGLAVAMLVGVTLAQGTGGEQGNGVFQPRAANAAVFLEQAAATVAQRPGGQERPRDDQWVYTKELTANETVEGDDPDDPNAKRGRTLSEGDNWFRFDGKEYASEFPGEGLQRHTLDLKGYDDRYPAQVRDYQASLPLDPDHLLAAVHAEVKRIYPDNPEFHHGEGLNNRTVWLIGVLLGSDVGVLPPPELQAALYRALAKVPGVTIAEDVTDLAGRKGVVLSHSWDNFSFGIVLDPETYAFLGEAYDVRDGKVYTGSALLKVGIVDEPGERP